MIYRTPIDQVKAYYDDTTAINQSSLKLILSQGMEKFLQKELSTYQEKNFFIIGQAVDCIITMGYKEFTDTYYLSTIAKKPGDKCMSIVKQAFDIISNQFKIDDIGPIQNYTETVYYACNENQYYMNRAKATYQEDTRIATLLKDNAADYWDELLISSSKVLLSAEEANTIYLIVNSLLKHKYTEKLFKDTPGKDIVYQFPMFFEYEDITCKGLIDKIIIDHNNKKIMPIDIKTMGFPVSTFKQAMKLRRYDIQGSFYYYGLHLCINSLSKLIDKDLKGYTISNFAFIVESSTTPGCPLIFPMTDRLMAHGKVGNGEDFEGWQQALGTYKAWKQEGFSLEKIVSKTNGVIFIDANFDYVYEKSI